MLQVVVQERSRLRQELGDRYLLGFKYLDKALPGKGNGFLIGHGASAATADEIPIFVRGRR